jgi:hypothetical protein
MKQRWQFVAVKTASGNVVTNWLGRGLRLQARMDYYLRILREMPPPWKMPYYEPLGDGVGAIRFDLDKVEHRLYGYFGPAPRQFTIILPSSDKKQQNKQIKLAKKLKRQYETSAPEVEEYDV